ncbi:Ubiquitin-associated protein 1-like [Liparis tanakae]|uniref:Ubiquitin-associated protein 1-like n=1 Tax=Liparis tanakae TaxID=230148 RepID=A0A4Z2JAT0_9TELE|nr:Ubiquitin-associated protein 1-like [Liparis tanakae]
MSPLEDVPFHIRLAPPEETVQLVTAPDLTLPDRLRILRDTKFGFDLEKWILTGQQPAGQAPSCPAYWLMFSSPQESRKANRRSLDTWSPSARPRSHSLNSRTVRFLVSDSEDEEGYREDNEASSTEDGPRSMKSRERPRSAAPRDQLSRVKDANHRKPASPQSLRGHRGSSPALQRASPLPRQKTSKKKLRSQASGGRKYSQDTPPAPFPPRRQQQRPSSAGPVGSDYGQKALRAGGSRGVFFDSSAELLSALSEEERELLGTITGKGFPLRTAILALQKTGYHSPQKILKYLVASERLCELGYAEAQVEEALEMFQNCESKAAEFLRLLTQFNEMGFQPNAIKEVLLVHENHRERALEELMTRTA